MDKLIDVVGDLQKEFPEKTFTFVDRFMDLDAHIFVSSSVVGTKIHESGEITWCNLGKGYYAVVKFSLWVCGEGYVDIEYRKGFKSNDAVCAYKKALEQSERLLKDVISIGSKYLNEKDSCISDKDFERVHGECNEFNRALLSRLSNK